MAIRAFVAAFPPVDVRDSIRRATAALRMELAKRGFRAIPAENYHVTLRFLGDIEPGDVPVVRALLEPLAAEASPIRCRCSGATALPSARRPRVIALELDSNDTLDAFGSAVQTALMPHFGAADRPFLPHLTVLRGTGTSRVDAPLPQPELTLELGACGLYRSDTVPGGARYTPLFELPFAAM